MNKLMNNQKSFILYDEIIIYSSPRNHQTFLFFHLFIIIYSLTISLITFYSLKATVEL